MIISIPTNPVRMCLSVTCGMVAHIGQFCGQCKQKGNDIEYTRSQIEQTLILIEKEKSRLRRKFQSEDNYFKNKMDEEKYIVDIDIATRVHNLYERADRLIRIVYGDNSGENRRRRLHRAKKRYFVS